MSAVQKRLFTINYPWMATNEKVTSAVATVAPNDGVFTATDVAIGEEGRKVQFMASGNGAALTGAEYTVTVQIATSSGQINEDCVEYRMENSCV